MEDSSKINTHKRKNSSVAGAALMIGVKPDTLELFLRVMLEYEIEIEKGKKNSCSFENPTENL